MSLLDQLKKAGLVSENEAKKAKAQNKRKRHKAKKNKAVAEEVAKEEKATLDEIAKEQEEKKEKDKQLNLAIEREREKRERELRCQQVLMSQRLNERRVNTPYYFLESDRFVRKIMVSLYQKEMLARGKLAIGKPYEHLEEYTIVPADTAVLVEGLCPHKIIVRHSEIPMDKDIEEFCA